MHGKNRPPNILITCSSRITSVELGAIIPLTEIQRKGLCNISYVDLISITLQHILWCDILFIVRGACPLSVWAAKWGKKFDRLVIGYWDDDLYSIPEYSMSHYYYSNSIMRDNMEFLFQIYDAFFTPSHRMAAKLSSMHGIEANVLPYSLGRSMNQLNIGSQNKEPIIGYVGSVDHAQMLNSMFRPVIDDLTKSGKKLTFHIIGPKFEANQGSLKVINTPHFVTYKDYSDYVSKLKWDVGLAPQMTGEFTKYKYYVKFLEYAYIGCAGIYSKVEMYSDVVIDGVTGLLSENDVKSWKENILKLISNPKLRLDVINNSRAFVRENNNLEVVADKYALALKPFLDHRATHNKAFISPSSVFSGWLDRIVKTIIFGYIVAKSLGIRRLISGILDRISGALHKINS